MPKNASSSLFRADVRHTRRVPKDLDILRVKPSEFDCLTAYLLELFSIPGSRYAFSTIRLTYL
jgi:hypothetical protein